jgi:hypothetical protein
MSLSKSKCFVFKQLFVIFKALCSIVRSWVRIQPPTSWYQAKKWQSKKDRKFKKYKLGHEKEYYQIGL